MPEITMMISDYSSAICDAMSYGKYVLYYAPDYEYYLNHDRGFLCDYKSMVGGLRANSTRELISLLISFRDGGVVKREVVNNVEEIRTTLLEASKQAIS